MRRRIFFFAAFLWMAVIFWFSARDADVSTEDSFRAGRIAAELVVPGFRDMTAGEQQAVLESLDHPVRKTAHFLEYAVLGVLLAGGFLQPECGRDRIRLQGFRAWASGTGYAVSDEFHQLFVPGRACMPADVLLDSAGVLAGTILCGILLFCIFAGNAGRNS